MSRLAVGTYEGRLFGWDVKPSHDSTSGEGSKDSEEFPLTYGFGAHEGPVRCVAMDSAGKFFVTGGADETIRIYNLKKRREVGVLLEHTDEVTCLAFVGRSHLLSAGADATICIWRCSDWLCLHKLGGHKGPVNSIAPHPTGRLALSVSKDRTLRLWDLVKGRIAFITRLEEPGEKVFWSPAADKYCILYRDKLMVYDAGSGDVTATFQHGSLKLHDAVWTPCDHIIAAGDESKLLVWNAAGVLLSEVTTPHRFRVRNIGYLACENSVVTTDPEGIVMIWSLAALTGGTTETLKPLKVLSDAGSSRCTCLVVHNEGNDADVSKLNEDAIASGVTTQESKPAEAKAKPTNKKTKDDETAKLAAASPTQRAEKKTKKPNKPAKQSDKHTMHDSSVPAVSNSGKSKMKLSVAMTKPSAAVKSVGGGAGSSSPATNKRDRKSDGSVPAKKRKQ